MSDSYMNGGYVIGKEHIEGRRYGAVVISRANWKIVYRAARRDWTKAAKAECAAWIAGRR